MIPEQRAKAVLYYADAIAARAGNPEELRALLDDIACVAGDRLNRGEKPREFGLGEALRMVRAGIKCSRWDWHRAHEWLELVDHPANERGECERMPEILRRSFGLLQQWHPDQCDMTLLDSGWVTAAPRE